MIISDLNYIEKSGDLDYIPTIISYIFEAGQIKDRNEFVDTLTKGLTTQEEKVMTIAEQFRAEGRAEGEAQAVNKTLKEVAAKMLQNGISAEDVHRITGISA